MDCQRETVINVRNAEKRDCNEIARFIKELSEFEKMADQVKLTAADLERDGFDSNPPLFQCLVAEVSDINANDADAEGFRNADAQASSIVVGYALYFPKYSTWEGKCIHLEDLYVTPQFRHKGVGTKLLRKLAKIAVDGNNSRLGLECLGWNKSALNYYKKLDAVDLTVHEDWHSIRFQRSALEMLAASDNVQEPKDVLN